MYFEIFDDESNDYKDILAMDDMCIYIYILLILIYTHTSIGSGDAEYFLNSLKMGNIPQNCPF